MNETILIKAFTELASNYWWLASLQHFLITIVLLLFWGNLKGGWRGVNRFITLYWSITFTFITSLLFGGGEMILTACGILLALPSGLFLLQTLLPVHDYTTEDTPKMHLLVGGLLIFIGIWYPVYSSSWLDAFLESPLGILPSSTLMVALGMQIILYPKTSSILLWLLVLLGFFFGLTGAYRMGIYWDIPLILGAAYGLKLLTDRKDPVQLDLAMEP